jgi:hypothetical protein
MQRPFNPIRRNRNIGTPKQGLGKRDKSIAQPNREQERGAFELRGDYQCFSRFVAATNVTFLVEPCKDGYIHPCSIADIFHVLTHLPPEDWRGIKLFALRQPTRRQLARSRAWGRLFHDVTFQPPDTETVYQGPAIALDAVDCTKSIEWTTVEMGPDDAMELERLRADGHRIERIDGRYVISMTRESARATQLYRTLLHEIGHWIDVREHSEPQSEHGGGARPLGTYFAQTEIERETFAHEYAAAMGARLSRSGVIPFELRE